LGFDSGGLHFDPESKKVIMFFGVGVLCGMADLFGIFFLTKSTIDAALAYGIPWLLTSIYSGALPLMLFPFKRSLTAKLWAQWRLLLVFRGFRFAWLPAFFVAIYIIVAFP
jgi:hypothetical protein